MKNKNILVTGASGFIVSNLIVSLIKENYAVGVDRNDNEFNDMLSSNSRIRKELNWNPETGLTEGLKKPFYGMKIYER